MNNANSHTIRQKWDSLRKNPCSLILFIMVWLCGITVMALALILVGHVLYRGIPELSPGLFAWHYTSENVSMLPAIINTVTLTLISLLLAVPTGIFSAVYLSEYSMRGSRLVKFVRTTTETLAGIPSIIYGQFGYLIFVIACGFGNSLLSGALTLAIMILPTVMRTTEEALSEVPDSLREGSFGLGAGHLRTIFKVVLPSAIPGIMSGVILSVGRIIGETAALIYTAGTVAGIPRGLFSSGRTLSVHMYALLSEGLYTGQAYATAVILLILVFVINLLSDFFAKKISAGKG